MVIFFGRQICPRGQSPVHTRSHVPGLFGSHIVVGSQIICVPWQSQKNVMVPSECATVVNWHGNAGSGHGNTQIGCPVAGSKSTWQLFVGGQPHFVTRNTPSMPRVISSGTHSPPGQPPTHPVPVLLTEHVG